MSFLHVAAMRFQEHSRVHTVDTEDGCVLCDFRYVLLNMSKKPIT